MKEPKNLNAIPELKEIHVREDITLRPLRSSDAIRLLEILESDSSIREKVTVASHFHSPKDVETEITRYRKESGLIRFTLLKGDTPIGLVSLWRDEGYFDGLPHLDDYGFGYFLDPKERGKGIATNTIQRLMDDVSKNLHVNRFVAFCADDNPESIAVLEKLELKRTDETFPEPYTGWIERKYIKSVK